MARKRYIYAFQEGDSKNKMLLEGKGANLCEMTQIGLNVPPGFVITTEACLAYLEQGHPPPRAHGRRSRRHVGHREEIWQVVRRGEKSFAGFCSLWLRPVHARHDGHHPQSGPKPRHDPGPDREQLEIAITAVFGSWNGKRAIDYRKQFRITPDMANGTAVNVSPRAEQRASGSA
jgi:phosphoenolpyruvate synthase/pyruvate phosphate dikinase